MGFSLIMNPLYVVFAASGIAPRLADRKRFGYFWASPKSDLRTAIVELKHDLTMRGIAGLIAAGGILFAALHLWPPHG
jgi:hypothetical protein